jgi:hypothetical protein
MDLIVMEHRIPDESTVIRGMSSTDFVHLNFINEDSSRIEALQQHTLCYKRHIMVE